MRWIQFTWGLCMQIVLSFRPHDRGLVSRIVLLLPMQTGQMRMIGRSPTMLLQDWNTST